MPTPLEITKNQYFEICGGKREADLFAIDDGKIYEALPKDEGEEKDEKATKKK